MTRLVRLLSWFRSRRSRHRSHQRDQPQAAGRADRRADLGAASFVEQSVTAPVELQPAETDTGVAQIDSLHIDESATARRAAVFHEDFDARAEAEAEVLRQMRATVVVADIPPLACAAADRAGVPSVVIGNFTWDWIYAAYPQFEAIAPGVVATIGAAYARAAQALRLPLHGGFETMRTVDPATSRSSRAGRAAAATSRAGCSGSAHERPSSWRRSADSASAGSRRDRARQHIPSDRHGRTRAAGRATRTTRCASRRGHLAERGLRYEDLIAAANVVVGKPGYGIVSECMANGAAFLYAPRSRFAEQDVFEREMPASPLPQNRERTICWPAAGAAPIEALLAQPPAPTVPSTNGAEAAAAAILEYL